MVEYSKRLLLAIVMTIILIFLIIGGKQSIANAEGVTEYDLHWELPSNGTITDIYGSRNKKHKGIDIADVVGTSIYAVDHGIVSKSYYSKSYGNVIFIKHEAGFETVYAHLKSRYVSEGQNVKQGEIIGSMGNTGKSSGPHLHFEVHKNEWTVSKKNAIDPFEIFGNGDIGDYVFAGVKKVNSFIEVAKKIENQTASYIVQSGDTLWDIAERYDTNIRTIKKLNGLNSERILPGQQLKIN